MHPNDAKHFKMTSSEIRQCQSCKNQFTIEPEDFNFYERIKVPAPTFCPQCRLQRRMAVSNERTLYKINCGLCGKSIVSIYPKDAPFPVYCMDCWRSDRWDATEYGRDYDFSKTFFEQLADLRKVVPRIALLQQGNMERSEYANRSSNCKDCYLVFRTNFSEGCLYSHPVNNSKDCVDCLNAQKCELAYGCVDCVNCYNVRYCQESKNCNNSAFLYDCRNCSDCFGCVNLRNKQYYIFNQPYSREDYLAKLAELSVASFVAVEEIRKQFKDFLPKFIKPHIMATNSVDVSGNWLDECKNVRHSFGCRNVENGKYLFAIIEGKDCMDYFYFGRGCELVYETSNCGYNSSRIFFSDFVHTGCTEIQYCDNCVSSSYSFGCSGLKSKQRCILNKQYSKEDYERLVPRIIEHMDQMPYADKNGRIYKYGEFYPVEIAVFAYNETAAQEYFPLTKERVLASGYSWREPERRDYSITLGSDKLPESINGVADSIINEVIGCAHGGRCNEQCTTAFRIIPQELQFYRRMNLPLPRLCPNCRHYERLAQRNPLKLWHRSCACNKGKDTYHNTAKHFHGEDPCPNEFETPYAPDRPEIVYCEQCYNAEVV